MLKNLTFIHSPSDFDVCLYHANCPDGIGAAYPFWKAHRTNNDFILKGVRYSDSYPSDIIRGKKVVIVDFCYSREEIVEICSIAECVLILDHHDTSKRNLENLKLPNLSYLFDMERSGAQIAWDYYELVKNPVIGGIKLATLEYMAGTYCSENRPWFIEVIADRDLWKWEKPGSNEIGKALYYEGWYRWERMLELEESEDPYGDREYFFAKGIPIVTIENRNIEYAVRSSVLATFRGHRVRMSCCNSNIRSEVGNALANMDDCDFAVLWRYDFKEDHWWISLRGGDNCDISLNQICELFGGGGHPKACGFTIHGPHSTIWKNASSEERMLLATGNLDSFFKIER